MSVWAFWWWIENNEWFLRHSKCLLFMDFVHQWLCGWPLSVLVCPRFQAWPSWRPATGEVTTECLTVLKTIAPIVKRLHSRTEREKNQNPKWFPGFIQSTIMRKQINENFFKPKGFKTQLPHNGTAFFWIDKHFAFFSLRFYFFRSKSKQHNVRHTQKLPSHPYWTELSAPSGELSLGLHKRVNNLRLNHHTAISRLALP